MYKKFIHHVSFYVSSGRIGKVVDEMYFNSLCRADYLQGVGGRGKET